jgi:2-haloacid dehalogenase
MELQALTFDIIGTTFDFFGSLGQGCGPLAAKYGLTLNGATYALEAEAGYTDGVAEVNAGAPWTPPDEILQDAIAAILPVAQLGQPKASEAIADFFGLWRTLAPWPDVPSALQALHGHYTLAGLSNMSVATQTALRAHAGLPFDRTLSAETVQHYKPNPAVYQMAISSLEVSPSQILMVAAHKYDLAAAQGQGFRTAFIARPLELGPNGKVDTTPDPSFDFNATSFTDLAEQLGAEPVDDPADCVDIAPHSVEVRQVAGRWKVVDGSQWLLDFGSNESDAIRAKAVIEYYGFDHQCFVGRPNAPMMYFTVQGAAPHGAMAGEDAIAFDLAGLVAQESGGSWIVTDGFSRMLDFGPSEVNALDAVTIIKRFAFTHQCFVGRPDAPMMYFRT